MNNRKKIAILLDCDGTLTSTPGGKLVFTKFYKDIKTDPEGDYSKVDLKPQGTIRTTMAQQFDKEHHDPRRISASATEFLNGILNLEDVEIAIISKNQKDYIRALFAYENLSTQGKNKNITIYAFKGDPENPSYPEFMGKQGSAEHFLKDKGFDTVFIFDDNNDDALGMAAGAAIAGCKDVRVVREDPGTFNWPQHLNDIKLSISAQHLNSSSTLYKNDDNQEKAEQSKTEILAPIGPKVSPNGSIV